MARSSKKKTQAKSRSKVKRAAKGAKKAAPKKVAKKAAPKKLARKAAPKKVAKKAGPKKVAAKKPAPKKPAAKKPGKNTGALSNKNAAVLSRANARAEVEGLLNRLPPPVAPIVKTLRKLVLEAAPEAVERVEGGEAAYFAGGMFARIEPHERDVLIKFMKGAQLPSNAVLKTDGKSGTVTLSSLDSVRASVLRTLVREAVMLNLDKSPVQARA